MRSLRHLTAAGSARKHFRIVLIRPSHYDDDGYVIRWYRSPMPANSLASVYGLIDDCAQRHILGSDTEIETVAIDETNTRVRIDRIISDMRANKAVNRGGGALTTSSASCGRITSKASIGFSSLTTISRVTRIGRQFRSHY